MNLFSSRQRHNAYCAFCRTPRRIQRRRNIGFGNIVASALTSIILMLALWRGPDPRAFVVFAVCLALAEFFVQIRWRLAIVCGVCDFDPILYVRDPMAAAGRVRRRLDRRKEDPHAILARPLNLPKLEASRAKQLAEAAGRKTGSIVSKSV